MGRASTGGLLLSLLALILPFGICSISDERAIAESIPLLLILDFEILPFFFEPSFVPLTLLRAGLDLIVQPLDRGPWTRWLGFRTRLCHSLPVCPCPLCSSVSVCFRPGGGNEATVPARGWEGVNGHECKGLGRSECCRWVSSWES